jgi:hypothetical protein
MCEQNCIMQKTNISRYSLGRILSIAACLFMVACIACSKAEDIPIPIPPPTPAPTPPSGVIQSFTVDDTLVAYNGSTSYKWLVTGTNSLTVVTLDGTPVKPYGVFGTGALHATTTYTLEINNGKKATVTITVADTLTSLLYNTGKRLKQTKYELLMGTRWADTTMSQTMIDSRTYFNIDNTSKIILVGPQPFVYNSGKFTVVQGVSTSAFTWQGSIYTVDFIDARSLVLTHDVRQPNGSKIFTRDTFVFE